MRTHRDDPDTLPDPRFRLLIRAGTPSNDLRTRIAAMKKYSCWVLLGWEWGSNQHNKGSEYGLVLANHVPSQPKGGEYLGTISLPLSHVNLDFDDLFSFRYSHILDVRFAGEALGHGWLRQLLPDIGSVSLDRDAEQSVEKLLTSRKSPRGKKPK